MKKRWMIAPLAVLLLPLLLYIFYTSPWDSSQDPPKTKETTAESFQKNGTIPWSSWEEVLRSGQVKNILLEPRGVAQMEFRDRSLGEISFPAEELAGVASDGEKAGAQVEIRPFSGSGSSFSWVQIFLLVAFVGGLGVFLFYIFWQKREDKNITKKQEELPSVSTRFDQVAGCPEAVEEIEEFVLFLRERDRFLSLGAHMPSGAVLHGPPGTGKTLLARALAGEAGVPFYHIAGSEAVNKYVGVGASTVRELFDKARRSPEGAVVFIDEIDAIGKKRSGDGEPSSREHDNTLNQLLVELDGFSDRENIIVLGATNRLDTLDPALLRPGRLSRQIPILPPDEKGRLAILEMYAKNKPLHDDVDLPALAAITSGSTGADLADMVNEAAIQAARAGREEISDSDFREGHLRALAGPARKSQSLAGDERRRVAFHEAGHVLAAELCPEHEKAERVTIVARGQAAGLAVWGQRDRALHSPEYVHQRLIAILGGRAAERVEFGTVSSGAANDLQQANELARTAIEDWGLSQKTGQLLSRSGHAVSDQTRSLVDEEVEEMVAEAFRDAVELLQENQPALQRLAEALLAEPVLERVDILASLGRLPRSKRSLHALRPGPSLQPVLGSPSPKEAKPQRDSVVALVRSKMPALRKRLRRRLRAT